jgi:hypothetical protein
MRATHASLAVRATSVAEALELLERARPPLEHKWIDRDQT